MLIVVEPSTHPILRRLSPEALAAWHLAISRCDRFRTDLVEVHELQGVGDALIDEWEQASLAARLPFGHVRMLGRGRLWQYDHRDLGRSIRRAA